MIRFILFLFFLTLILAFQISFLASFVILSIFNLALIGLVLLVFLADFKKAIIFTVWSGVILDIYSTLPFGVFLFSFLITLIILEFLFLNFFTNRSFYSLIFLGFLGAITYQTLFLMVSGFLYLVGLSDFFFFGAKWYSLLSQTLATVAALIFCFWLINKISKRFKPIFLK